jgi:hypothetical protein
VVDHDLLGDPGFEPSGREPELPGHDKELAPMLGGERRLWPSVSAYLLSAQHRAHRRGEMERVWAIRQMRARIQARSIRQREDAYAAGEAVQPLTDDQALAEIQTERRDVADALEQCRRWLRPIRAAELERTLAVIDEVLAFWESRAGE